MKGGTDEDDVPRAPDMAPETAACLGSTKVVGLPGVAEAVAGGSSPMPMRAWGGCGRRRLPTGGEVLSGRRGIGKRGKRGKRGDCEGSGEEPERMTCPITTCLLGEEEETLLDDEYTAKEMTGGGSCLDSEMLVLVFGI